ncbi:hypothetical protein ACWCQL_37340 [Streptomyces sp. NPDC002073]
MPIDPFAALNAMLRAEAARSTPQPPSAPATRPPQDGPGQPLRIQPPETDPGGRDRDREPVRAAGSEEPRDRA